MVKKKNNVFQPVAFIGVIMKLFQFEVKKSEMVKYIKDSSTHLHGFWPMGNHGCVFMWLQARQ